LLIIKIRYNNDMKMGYYRILYLFLSIVYEINSKMFLLCAGVDSDCTAGSGMRCVSGHGDPKKELQFFE